MAGPGLFVVLDNKGADVYVYGVREDTFLIYSDTIGWCWVAQSEYWLPETSDPFRPGGQSRTDVSKAAQYTHQVGYTQEIIRLRAAAMKGLAK